MRAALLLVTVLVACAPKLPPAYVRARDTAESDYASGHFTDAGKAWLNAADSASTPRDRSDARYRAATSYQRAGELDKARELYELLAAGKSDRAARSAFTLADLRLQGGDEAGGYAELEAAIRKYPSSGVANLALTRYFAFLASKGGDKAVLEYATRPPPELAASELAEQLLYERARRLDMLGRTKEARDAYVELADRYPYPHGAYWDDALFRGADCEQRLHQSQGAIDLLERMIAAREASRMSGSYERSRFADAAFRVAELYRDEIKDLDAARRAFHSVFVNYPTSTLRDDALWQEALLARGTSDTAACAPLSLLVTQLPDSRFAPCAHELCNALRPIAQRQCRDYIERDLHKEPKAESAD
jgi:TolA-binding protein